MADMRITRIDSLDELSPRAWNALRGTDNPFMRFEFLAALEHHGCVGDDAGWVPHFLVAERDGQLVGAVPMYLKYHSFGEFVFDWAWAHAYENTGRRYYPKLVVAAPYTPITGPRILAADTAEGPQIVRALIDAALEQARSLKVSSLHWLFVNREDAPRLQERGLMRRAGCQFHWLNRGYRDFDDFLDQFSSAKRKKIKRERRRVTEGGIEYERVPGDRINETHWDRFYDFYHSTFWKKGNFAPLSRSFFSELSRAMPDNVMLILAKHRGEYVGGALFLHNDHTLYGRHWGCSEEFHSLHFETCYYRAIDFCIERGIKCFEAGAQGEHKVSRGFVPVTTWSAHWVRDERFRLAVDDFLGRERQAIASYVEELQQHLPYKAGIPGQSPEDEARDHCSPA